MTYLSLADIHKGDTITWLGDVYTITKTKTGNSSDMRTPAFWAGDDLMFTWRSSLREYRAFGYPASTDPCTFN